MRRLYYWVTSNDYFHLFCVAGCIFLLAGYLVSIIFFWLWTWRLALWFSVATAPALRCDASGNASRHSDIATIIAIRIHR